MVRVYESVKACPALDDVLIATDSAEIFEVCQRRGCKVQMTASSHRSGTERVHEISNSISADVYINVQGDEPLARQEHVSALIKLMSDENVLAGTLKTPARPEDAGNANVVKVVADIFGRALYFSRAAIPHDREGTGSAYFKHLGFYAYRKPALDSFVSFPESSLERSEKLEQLRFLENGIPIFVGETPFDTVGVDTEEDLRRVETILRCEQSK